jgi:hypothetical protein
MSCIQSAILLDFWIRLVRFSYRGLVKEKAKRLGVGGQHLFPCFSPVIAIYLWRNMMCGWALRDLQQRYLKFMMDSSRLRFAASDNAILVRYWLDTGK